jgi:hypothetical protein
MKKRAATKKASAAAPSREAKGQGYGQLVSAISSINTQMVTRAASEISHTLPGKSEPPGLPASISHTAHGKFTAPHRAGNDSAVVGDGSPPTPLGKLPTPLEPAQLARLSRAHFLELIRLDDPWKRAFYDKDGAEVEFATAGMDQKLFVTRYLTALPSADQLKAFLERDRAELKALIQSKD